MFESNLDDKIKLSKFTTVKIDKNFLPRRVGLGYEFEHTNLEVNIIKECKKKRNLKKYKKEMNEASEESEDFSKSKMIK